jgi:Domain of unknown function (DUF5664)
MSRKDDVGKLDMTLLTDSMGPSLIGVVEVLQWAVTDKTPTPYIRGSWKEIPEGARRYKAALVRHLLESELTDSESGLLHAQHVATNALMYLDFVLRDASASHPKGVGKRSSSVAEYNPC